MYQNAARIGRAVSRARKIHVFSPPPSLYVKYNGTRVRREIKALLLKASGPSAGKGAFLIAGYFADSQYIILPG